MTERWLNRRSVVQVPLKAGNLHAYRGLSAITLRASQFDSGRVDKQERRIAYRRYKSWRNESQANNTR